MSTTFAFTHPNPTHLEWFREILPTLTLSEEIRVCTNLSGFKKYYNRFFSSIDINDTSLSSNSS